MWKSKAVLTLMHTICILKLFLTYVTYFWVPIVHIKHYKNDFLCARYSLFLWTFTDDGNKTRKIIFYVHFQRLHTMHTHKKYIKFFYTYRHTFIYMIYNIMITQHTCTFVDCSGYKSYISFSLLTWLVCVCV